MDLFDLAQNALHNAHEEIDRGLVCSFGHRQHVEKILLV